MNPLYYIVIGIAAMWLLSFIGFCVMCRAAPRGREIPGVGFVRDLDEDDGCEFVNNNSDGGKQVEKWERRYGTD